MSTDQWRAAHEKGRELLRIESLQLLTQAGLTFKDDLTAGRLVVAIDRGFARQFLPDPRSEPVARSLGVSLRPIRLVVNALMLLEPLCGIALMGLSFILIGP